MDFEDDEKAAGEILRSLLTTKMENPVETDVRNWTQLDTKAQVGNFHPQEQVVWHIESNIGGKPEFISDGQNLMQHIPVTYLATNDRNIAFTNARAIIKPVTYIVRQNEVSDVPRLCEVNDSEGNVMLNGPSSIVLMKNFNSDILKVNDTLQMPEHQIQSDTVPIHNLNSSEEIVTMEEGRINDSKKKMNIKLDKKVILTKKNKSEVFDSEISSKFKKLESGNESFSLTKSKLERKISGCKKSLKKRKNSKLNKKTLGKPLQKKSLKNLKPMGCEKGNENDENETTEKNLFELTKLEDNVNQVIERLKIGCDCADTNCFDGLDPDKVFKHRLNIADLTKAEHDMYLMGVIMASVQNLEETCRHKERIRIRSCYAYQGKRVCLTAFLYLQHVTLYQMKRLRSHLKNHGVSPRIHGNRGRKPANTFSLDIYHCATSFVQNYIEKHCVKSVPNFTTFSFSKTGGNSISNTSFPVSKVIKKSNKVKIANKITSFYLPSECTKKTVHREYKSFCENLKPSQKAMKYSTFTNFLQKQFPNVKFYKVDKKQLEKCGHLETGKASENIKIQNKINKIEEKAEATVDNYEQETPTLLYIPAKTVPVGQATTLLVASKQGSQIYNKTQLVGSPTVKNAQIVVDGKNLQLVSDGGNDNDLEMDFRFPNRVLIGNQIYGAQASGNAIQMYAADSVVKML